MHLSYLLNANDIGLTIIGSQYIQTIGTPHRILYLVYAYYQCINQAKCICRHDLRVSLLAW